jgi:hypothetical protein
MQQAPKASEHKLWTNTKIFYLPTAPYLKTRASAAKYEVVDVWTPVLKIAVVLLSHID